MGPAASPLRLEATPEIEPGCAAFRKTPRIIIEIELKGQREGPPLIGVSRRALIRFSAFLS